MFTMPSHGLQIQSKIDSDGELHVSLANVPVPAPQDDEILIRVDGAPINPSDIAFLLGPADLSTLSGAGEGDSRVLKARMEPSRAHLVAGRMTTPSPIGNEGAGQVVAAGSSSEAQALMGKNVATLGGAMYSQYRLAKVADVIVLPDGTSAEDGASSFVNPLTALGFVETMRMEKHTAIVHTAAASNLGQMLVKLCRADGVPLVNIVRSADQAAILRNIGATHVCNSTDADFMARLVDALVETGATVAFDAIGGGSVGSQILMAMETAASARASTTYNRYGTDTFKQLYIYGGLDTAPTQLTRGFGFSWGVNGWLMSHYLRKLGEAEISRLKQRVARELKTTFASHYTRSISLHEALDPQTAMQYAKRATGEKFLIRPNG